MQWSGEFQNRSLILGAAFLVVIWHHKMSHHHKDQPFENNMKSLLLIFDVLKWTAKNVIWFCWNMTGTSDFSKAYNTMIYWPLIFSFHGILPKVPRAFFWHIMSNSAVCGYCFTKGINAFVIRIGICTYSRIWSFRLTVQANSRIADGAMNVKTLEFKLN